MRTIEPMGRTSSVPPAHPTSLPSGLLRQGQSGSFYELLQNAASVYRKPSGPAQIGHRLVENRRVGYVGFSR